MGYCEVGGGVEWDTVRWSGMSSVKCKVEWSKNFNSHYVVSTA